MFKKVLPIFFLVILVYLIFLGTQKGFGRGYTNFGSGAHGFFGASIVALSTVFVVPFFSQIKITKKALYLALLGITLYIVVITGSRNAFLTFVFVLGMSYYVVNGLKLKMGYLVTFIFLLLGLIVLMINIENNPILNRLGLSNGTSKFSTEEVTSGRTSLWKAGIEGFFDYPVTGLGFNPVAVRHNAMTRYGVDNISHNTLIEFAVNYGVFGIIMFLVMLNKIRYGLLFFKHEWRRKHVEIEVFIPFVMYLSVIFSSFFVSWMWDSLVWYPFIISLSLQTSYLSKNSKNEIA